MKFDLKKSRTTIAIHEQTISDLKYDMSLQEMSVSNLNKMIETYNVPKLLSFDKNKVYHRNKLVNLLGDNKSCKALLSFLGLSDMANLGFTCKLAKAFITSAPSFLGVVAQNTYFERINLNTTNLNASIQEIKTEIAQQDRVVVMGVKRYLYYNYSVIELVESLIEDSINKIDQLQVDLKSERSEERQRKGSMMNFLKSALNIKEEKPVAKIKFNRIKKIPLDLYEKVSQMISSTPFEKFCLLDTSQKKIDISNPKEYRATQNKMFKEEIDKKSAEYITEFNGLLQLMGRHFLNRREF